MKKFQKLCRTWAYCLSIMLVVFALIGTPSGSNAAADLGDGGAGTDSNGGLTFGGETHGGNVYLYWSNEAMPPAPTGFVVARSLSPYTGYSQISPVLSPYDPTFVDYNAPSGYNYYAVVLVKSDNSYDVWVGPLCVYVP